MQSAETIVPAVRALSELGPGAADPSPDDSLRAATRLASSSHAARCASCDSCVRCARNILMYDCTASEASISRVSAHSVGRAAPASFQSIQRRGVDRVGGGQPAGLGPVEKFVPFVAWRSKIRQPDLEGVETLGERRPGPIQISPARRLNGARPRCGKPRPNRSQAPPQVRWPAFRAP